MGNLTVLMGLMKGTVVSQACLGQVNLCQANFSQVCFSKVNFGQACLGQANLSQVDLVIKKKSRLGLSKPKSSQLELHCSFETS